MSGKVYRDFDQAELDRQYNIRSTVPDFTVYTRRYAALTREAKRTLSCIENLRYGDGADEALDFYPSRITAGAPLQVFLHGGNWQLLGKDDSGFAAPAFVAAGASFVAVNFSVVPQTTVTGMGKQVRRAIAWLANNAAAHGGDGQRIHVSGHSSGANLVGQLLTADWPREFGLPAGIIKSAAFMSGLGDLEPVRLGFRNEKLKLDPAQVAEVSLLRGRPGGCCPLIVAFGENETPEYKRQGREVAAFWESHGNKVEVFELRGRNHYDAVLEFADPKSALFQATLAQMGISP